MILYQLHCDDDHSFEAWFRDSASYDVQVAEGDVECPYCGSTTIAKSPMAPHIASGRAKADESVSESAPESEPMSSAPTSSGTMSQDDMLSEQRAHEVAQQILDAVGRIRDYAEQNFEDVGEDFADEARKMHYGDADERGISGKASEQDAEELEDEGIEFVRLPGTPRRNS